MRWPTAAGGCRSMRRPPSIPDISSCCWPMRIAVSARMRGVDPLALGRAALQLVTPRPHRLRRLDHHDAAGAADGAAARALGLRKTAPDGARGSDRAATEQGRDPRSLSGAGAVRRQSRRHPRRLHRLFRQGAEAAVAGGSPRCWWRCRNRRNAAGSIAIRKQRMPRAIACSTGWSRMAWCRKTTPRRRRRSRCRSCASRCRSWRRIPADAAMATVTDTPVDQADAGFQPAENAGGAGARPRGGAGAEHFGRDHRGRQ